MSRFLARSSAYAMPPAAGLADLRRAPLVIGDVELANAVFLAPMAGVTDLPFRRIAARYGVGAVVSEMVAASGLVSRAMEDELRVAGEGLFPHIVQIAGCDPEAMAEGARIAEGSGAHVIDINMGCPAKRVSNRLAGAALMQDLDAAALILSAVRRAVSVPVTVKMRLGWDDDRRNAADLARRAEAEGICLVTVHGRTRNQFYKGVADWQAVRDVVDAVAIPVVVNGDIVDIASARTALHQSGAAAVMVGRGAVGRPWVPAWIGMALSTGTEPSLPSPDEVCAVTLELFRAMREHYPGRIGSLQARKHLAAVMALYPSGAVGAEELKQEILVSADDGFVERGMAEWLGTAEAMAMNLRERTAA